MSGCFVPLEAGSSCYKGAECSSRCGATHHTVNKMKVHHLQEMWATLSAFFGDAGRTTLEWLTGLALVARMTLVINYVCCDAWGLGTP